MQPAERICTCPPLCPDADQLLITGESGELALVRADPAGLDELARIEVLQGKTWNHPALLGTRLYMRNSREAVALELVVVPQGRGATYPSRR